MASPQPPHMVVHVYGTHRAYSTALDLMDGVPLVLGVTATKDGGVAYLEAGTVSTAHHWRPRRVPRVRVREAIEHTPSPRWARLAVTAAIAFAAGVLAWNLWGAP